MKTKLVVLSLFLLGVNLIAASCYSTRSSKIVASNAVYTISVSSVSGTTPLHTGPAFKYDGQGPTDIFLLYAESTPNPMIVSIGTRVTWYNMDEHSYGLSSDDGLFFASLDGDGGSFSYVFDSPGTYWYDIDPYPGMKGSVVVV